MISLLTQEQQSLHRFLGLGKQSQTELLLPNRSGTCSTRCPKPCCRILLAKSGFILEPDIHLLKADMARDVTDRFQ